MKFKRTVAAVGIAFVTAFLDDPEDLDPDVLDALAGLFESVDPWELALVLAAIVGPRIDREEFDRIVLNVVKQKAAAQ